MRRWLMSMAVLLVLGGAGYWYFVVRSQAAEQTTADAGGGRRRGRGSDPAEIIPVAASRSERRDVNIWLDGLGTVQAFNSVQVKAQVDGPLIEVRFTEGQDVRQGDVLARIDPRPFQATLDQQMAKKQQDEANLANARVDLVRYTKLSATAYSSAQQADTQKAMVAQLEAQVRGDQAQVDSARVQLGYTTITAPIDGRTGLRQVDLGNIVHSADMTPLTVITQLHPISVVFTLPQQNLPAVARAMQQGSMQQGSMQQGSMQRGAAEGGAQVEAIAQGGSRTVLDHGTLAVLDNQVDPATGTIKMKATFPNAGLTLWPGGFVNVRLLVDTQRGVVTAPTAAVQRGPTGPYVYVIKADETAERRPVRVGHEDDDLSVIADGLQPGEQVVVDGASRLSQGTHVAVAGPDGNAPAAVPVARERSAPGAGRGRS